MKKRKISRFVTLFILTAFALLTLFLSSSVIFDWFGIRAKEGNYVPMVVWVNFISSMLYLIAAYGLLKLKKWTVKPLLVSVFILIGAMVGLYAHIDAGGLYETKTIGALFIRTALTLGFSFMAYLITIKWKNPKEK
ncbi:hypothetical protein SAMN05421636_105134 [Pricia antarctica]|uniref:Uncharacterized protein n=1 Tax=Pricia antarctica TaxID=641691 RepID=A0A1G7D1T9_9FLAO|nr:hypothetical protein [Pricia antarctica]SDE45487.1 hypothetical protein SAMN05421636_105134 [Pricia antarctica]